MGRRGGEGSGHECTRINTNKNPGVGCQSQGKTVEETLTNIREAIELFLETLTDQERSEALSHEILTTAVEEHA